MKHCIWLVSRGSWKWRAKLIRRCCSLYRGWDLGRGRNRRPPATRSSENTWSRAGATDAPGTTRTSLPRTLERNTTSHVRNTTSHVTNNTTRVKCWWMDEWCLSSPQNKGTSHKDTKIPNMKLSGYQKLTAIVLIGLNNTHRSANSLGTLCSLCNTF